MSSDPLNNQSNPSKTDASTEGSNGGFLSNLLSGKTPGVANIEAAYSRAGATNHHTPGHASALGNSNKQDTVADGQGVGSKKFSEGIQDQREEVRTLRYYKELDGTVVT